jgi:dipeptidyl-peptidase-4
MEEMNVSAGPGGSTGCSEMVGSAARAAEYLARVYWLPDGCAAAQWQNRGQSVAVLMRAEWILERGKGRTLSGADDVWIIYITCSKFFRTHSSDRIVGGIERNIPPFRIRCLTELFVCMFASRRTGFSHLYLSTPLPWYCGGASCTNSCSVRR